ncbi:MAG: TetR/AcrR family transcriptional regulator [Hymenobacteraceae bacterium]|nr:TetR/AcrR family transcriptional regulator [Hymenobacteraceae bacterium]MDX5480828.1 TetR/AcrR family transcriptional regulator [Hymenobacteraceae bacterium]
MNKHRLRREQSTNLLVDTALQLFSEKGYDRTSIRHIAQEAGVSLGLLYNYFKSKEELLHEIFRRMNADIQASFAQAEEEEGMDALNGLERHIRQTVKLLKEKRSFWRLLHSLRYQREVTEQVAQEIQEQVLSIEARISQNLKAVEVASPELEAKLLFAAIDGLASHYLLLDNYPIDELAELLIRKYQNR